jgi:carbamate kinase
MLIVVSLGGDVLRPRGEAVAALKPEAMSDHAAQALAALAVEHHLVLACAWGPLAGLESLHDTVGAGVPTYPLEVLDREAEHAAGHLFEQAIARRLPADRLATLVARIVVDADDPALDHPATPVGPLFDFPEAERLARAHGWAIAPDREGVGWRHVVASPRPRAIAELGTFRILVDGGVTVLWPVHATLPVVRTPVGGVRRVEAAVDSDLAAARLAADLDADALLLVSPADARDETAGASPARVDAVRGFIDQGGWLGAIAPLSDVAPVLRGEPAATATVWGQGAGVALA